MLSEVKLSYDPVCPSVGGRSVGRSVCHDFLKGREVPLPCFYRSTIFFACIPLIDHINTAHYFRTSRRAVPLKFCSLEIRATVLFYLVSDVGALLDDGVVDGSRLEHVHQVDDR